MPSHTHLLQQVRKKKKEKKTHKKELERSISILQFSVEIDIDSFADEAQELETHIKHLDKACIR